MVPQQDLPRQGQRAAADHTHIGDGVVGGPEGVSGNAVRAPAGTPADVLDVHSHEALGQKLIGQHRVQTTRMHAPLGPLCVNLTSMFILEQLPHPRKAKLYGDPLLINS
jgi:hypothetical protein